MPVCPHPPKKKKFVRSSDTTVVWHVTVRRGQTALHVAVLNGERKICYLLVSAGAPLLAVDKHNRTAQQIAEQTKDYDLAKYLECKYARNDGGKDIC